MSRSAFGDGAIVGEAAPSKPRARARCGALPRAVLANNVKGVTEGFEKNLEMTGVGYRAAMQGKNLQLQLGYSHEIIYTPPEGITIATPKPTEIKISGIDSAGRRPSRRRNPLLPSARALQGQGRALCRRTHPPQGRQEEVSHAAQARSHRPPRPAQSHPLKKVAGGRLRLSVFRSSKNISAQLIDDMQGRHRRRRLDARGRRSRRAARPAPTRRPPPPSAS